MDKKTLKLAIPVFRSRVAPVFNWCSKIQIYSGDAAEPSTTLEITCLDMNPFDRLQAIHREGAKTLICGALSPDLLHYGAQIGLRIIPGVAGEVRDVLQAYRANRLDRPHFWLPGCRGSRRYRHRCTSGTFAPEPSKQVSVQAFDGASRSRLTNNRSADMGSGPGGACVCHGCGTKVHHQRGIPCNQLLCPVCSQTMVRE